MRTARQTARRCSAIVVLAGSIVWGGPAARSYGDGPAVDEPREVLRLGDVDFPHQAHFEELGLECASCHHETDAAELSIPHPEYFADFWIRCSTCHRAGATPPRPLACSACHHGSPTDIADETLSAKVVIHRSCWQCHEVGTGPEASRGCRTCHASGLPPARGASHEEGAQQ